MYACLRADIVSGKRPPSYLVYSTGKGEYPTAGGLSSRLRGITTVFFMAVLLGKSTVIPQYLVVPSQDVCNTLNIYNISWRGIMSSCLV